MRSSDHRDHQIPSLNLNDFPDALLVQIFSYLSQESIGAVRLVNSHFYHVSRDEALWEHIAEQLIQNAHTFWDAQVSDENYARLKNSHPQYDLQPPPFDIGDFGFFHTVRSYSIAHTSCMHQSFNDDSSNTINKEIRQFNFRYLIYLISVLLIISSFVLAATSWDFLLGPPRNTTTPFCFHFTFAFIIFFLGLSIFTIIAARNFSPYCYFFFTLITPLPVMLKIDGIINTPLSVAAIPLSILFLLFFIYVVISSRHSFDFKFIFASVFSSFLCYIFFILYIDLRLVVFGVFFSLLISIAAVTTGVSLSLWHSHLLHQIGIFSMHYTFSSVLFGPFFMFVMFMVGEEITSTAHLLFIPVYISCLLLLHMLYRTYSSFKQDLLSSPEHTALTKEGMKIYQRLKIYKEILQRELHPYHNTNDHQNDHLSSSSSSSSSSSTDDDDDEIHPHNSIQEEKLTLDSQPYALSVPLIPSIDPS